MIVTEFSFLMAVLWSSAILLAGALLTRSKRFVSWFGISGFLIVMFASVLRLLIPVEILGAAVIGDTVFMPVIQRMLRVEVLELFSNNITRGALLLALWAVGSFLYMSVMVFRIIRQKKAISVLPTTRSLQYESIMSRIAEGRRFEILISESIGSPAMTGLFVPTILMPDITLSDAEAECVFRHEWYHFRHRDLWKKLLFNILCSFLWWNPLMYFIRSKLNYILEVNCDYSVIKEKGDSARIDYVETTLSVLRQVTSIRPMPYAVTFADTARPNDFTRRCELLLFPPKAYGPKAKASSFFFLLFLMMTSYAFVVQPSSPAPISAENEIVEIEISPSNSYLRRNNDGTYTLFVTNEEWGTIQKTDLEVLPYSCLHIK